MTTGNTPDNIARIVDALPADERNPVTPKASADSKANAGREAAASYLLDHPELYFVKTEDQYFEFDLGANTWHKFVGSALKTSDFRLRVPGAWAIFQDLMERAGKVKDSRGFHFHGCPPNVLNEFRNDRWLKPEAGEVHPGLRILFETLGDNDPAKVRHIKELLGWKYLHPEDTQVPCLCFYGQGGAGKNVLADKVARIIFGPGSTTSVLFERVEKFNGALAGKMVVNFDEMATGASKLAVLNRTVGAVDITIERKGVNAVDMPNSALYMISTNSVDGAFKIQHNNSTRRFSFMRLTTTLEENLRKVGDLSAEDARWYLKEDLMPHVYENPVEVARLLHECVTLAGALRTTPTPMQGADYETLLDAQAGPEEDVLHEVFGDPRFEFITFDTLFELYVARVESDNPAARPKSLRRYMAEADEYIRHHGLEAVRFAGQKKVGRKLARLFCRPTWAKAMEGKTAADNSDYYRQGKHSESAAAVSVVEAKRPQLVALAGGLSDV